MRSRMTACAAVLLGVCCAGLGGCETFTQPAKFKALDSDKDAVVQANSNRRLSYIIRKKEGTETPVKFIVSEPPPDTALQSAVKLTGSLTSGTTSGDVAAQVAQKIIELTKRTQAVVILRDALFRLELAYANGAISKERWATEFGAVLLAAETIALSDIENPETSKIAADALVKLAGEREAAAQADADVAKASLLAEQNRTAGHMEAEALAELRASQSSLQTALNRINDTLDRLARDVDEIKKKP